MGAFIAANGKSCLFLKEGKVKRVYTCSENKDKLLFYYTNNISVFDKVIFSEIPRKGEALCRGTAYWFKSVENEGICDTHYLDTIAPNQMLVRRVDKVEKPTLQTDSYLIPLEFICRHYAAGSFLDRVNSGELKPQDIGLSSPPKAGDKLPEPYFEATTKFEKVDRHLTIDEALQVGGLTRGEYNEIREIVLKIDEMTGQVAHQYYYTDYFSRMTSLCGGVANFAENIRNSQQTEVAEMAEQTLSKQVGSSTGAHKKNPISCENISGGQWRHLKSEFMTTLDDLITDFQRDLRDSSNKRYYIYGIGNTALYMISTGAKVAKNLTVRKEKMAENLGMTRGLICAEPLQMVLQDWVGRSSEEFVDTHEHVRVLTNKAIESGISFQDAVNEDELVQKVLKDASPEVVEMIFDPSKYIGTAVKDVEDYIKNCNETISAIEMNLEERKKFNYV